MNILADPSARFFFISKFMIKIIMIKFGRSSRSTFVQKNKTTKMYGVNV